MLMLNDVLYHVQIFQLTYKKIGMIFSYSLNRLLLIRLISLINSLTEGHVVLICYKLYLIII